MLSWLPLWFKVFLIIWALIGIAAALWDGVLSRCINETVHDWVSAIFLLAASAVIGPIAFLNLWLESRKTRIRK